MKKVYIVTSGEYSDYRIEAIFSEKETAERLVQKYNDLDRWDEWRVEEWALDSGDLVAAANRKQDCYIVRMAKNGDVVGVGISNHINDAGEIMFDIYNQLVYKPCAKSKEHAIKITNEKRAQLIANNQWPKKEG